MMSDKEVQKERAGLIRYLFTLPDSIDRTSSSFSTEDDRGYHCLCAQGQVVKRFIGYKGNKTHSGSLHYPFDENIDMAIKSLGITKAQWNDMETRYEGGGMWKEDIHTFKQIATWLQTLEGWPTVL